MEMKTTPLLRLQPALHLCTLVRAVVIHDEVDLLIRRELAFQVIQEANEFPAAVTLLAGADHLPIEDVESREQGRRAVTFVVVGLPLWQARSQGKNRRGPIERLDLTLLIHAQYQRTVGWVQV